MLLTRTEDDKLAYYLVPLACNHCGDLRAWVPTESRPRRARGFCSCVLEACRSFLENTSGEHQTLGKATGPKTQPLPTPAAFHFENHMYHEVSCSLGESCLVLCFFFSPSEKGPERKSQRWGGIPGYGRRQAAEQPWPAALLDLSKRSGVAGRTPPESECWLELRCTVTTVQ